MARGDRTTFDALYTRIAAPVYGSTETHRPASTPGLLRLRAHFADHPSAN